MKRNGFTLAEVVVAFAIVVVVTLVVTTVMLSSQKSWISGSAQMTSTSQLRRALDWMSRELAESRPGEIVGLPADGVWRTAILFRIPEDQNGDGEILDANGNIAEWSDSITYQLGAENTCVRSLTTAGTTEVLAHHISSLEFRRQDAAPATVEIRIAATVPLTEGQTVSRSLTTRVHLRN